MSKGLMQTARTLCKAMNIQGPKGHRYAVGTREKVSGDGKTYTLYTVYDNRYDHDRKKWVTDEVYVTGSLVRVVFFMRDMWNEATGRPVDYSDEKWNETRKKLQEKRGAY